jgi:hypothetical protein
MTQPEPARPEPGPDADIDDIQTDIEQTRKELGETVEALSAKMDVKQRAKDKAAETKEAVVEKAGARRSRSRWPRWPSSAPRCWCGFYGGAAAEVAARSCSGRRSPGRRP